LATSARRLYGIYAVLPSDRDDLVLVQQAEAALKGGIRILQLRNKRQYGKALLMLAQRIRHLTANYGATLIVNDALDLALAVGADGVHLGRSDIGDISQLRKLAGDRLLVGASCQGDIDYGRSLLEHGVDQLSFGAVYPTKSKAEARPIGLEHLVQMRKALPEANIVAIGGITLKSLPSIRQAGADSAAVISDLFDHADIEGRAAELVECWGGRHAG